MSSPIPTGRPRDTELTERVLTEVAKHILGEGLPSFRIETIAQRALTTKPAIYRRWPNRADLILDSIGRILPQQSPPSSGDLLTDLKHYVVPIQASDTHAGDATATKNLICAVVNPEILPSYMERFGNDRRRVGMELLQHWIEQGALPADLDRGLFLDALLGLTMHRSLIGGGLVHDAEYDALLGALRAAPPRIRPAARESAPTA
ncbi:TetR-like C-terminal domain-containing protein [Leucobacter sp. M11]|uniref:TetR-like C-terminal domain-containing protein n=1 Tax=Leucobacter sp. M11 TaxID=2993565 RepID=UPI002D802D66|nr:TetR-like C-terminal domain-containing protein [Leucobacter sp. M11]MEB4615366.1 TetR-like C-terminal domain-containing protein [Leucobacter sp. M11]